MRLGQSGRTKSSPSSAGKIACAVQHRSELIRLGSKLEEKSLMFLRARASHRPGAGSTVACVWIPVLRARPNAGSLCLYADLHRRMISVVEMPWV